jgi:hypothetical protein
VANPLFVRQDSLRIQPGSPCIDAASNAEVPADTADLDADGDTQEPLPLDADWLPRFLDDAGTPDTGQGTPPIVDMGAYEFHGTTGCPGDLDGDRRVGQSDLGLLLAAFGVTARGDLDGDGDTDQADLGILLANWQRVCP